MRLYTERTRAEDRATQGCDRSADAEVGIEGDRVAPFGAYGDILGRPGRESDLKTLRFRAEVCLALAVVVQIIDISLIARLWTVRLAAIGDRIVLREGFPLAIGLVSAALLFVMLRG